MAQPTLVPSVMTLPSGFKLPFESAAAPSSSAAAPSSSAPLAPPEAIPLELPAIEQAFIAAGRARFLDLSGRFSFEERAKIAAAVTELADKSGAKVYALALPGKTDVNNYATIHKDLKLAHRDVLFIFSADKRHLHSQAIPKNVGSDILKETNKEFYRSQSAGVVQMLDLVAGKLGVATAPSVAVPAPSAGAPAAAKKPLVPIEWVLMALAVAVIGYLLVTTRKKKTT